MTGDVGRVTGHDDLVLRNAHLSQRVTCLEQDVVRQAADAERRLAERDDVLGGQTATIARLRETTEALETRVTSLSLAIIHIMQRDKTRDNCIGFSNN